VGSAAHSREAIAARISAVSERTVSHDMPRLEASRDAIERWKSFLRNHRKAIVTMASTQTGSRSPQRTSGFSAFFALPDDVGRGADNGMRRRLINPWSINGLITLVSAVAIVGQGCRSETDHPSHAAATLDAGTAAPDSLSTAVERAAEYLSRFCKQDGRFVYRQDNGMRDERRYNVVRHAGSIYALADYYRHTKDERVKEAMLRATAYLLKRYVKPLQSIPELLAVWSLPEEETRDGRPAAKLGGTALGLVALIEGRKLDPNIVPMDVLQSLGQFLVFMQRPSGGFYSKYDDAYGVDRRFDSLYYPGEAILALTLLYEYTKDPQWFEAATKGANFLIQERQHVPPDRLPADHWLMIASAKLRRHLSRQENPQPTRAILLEHNRELARVMLAEQARVTESWAIGSFMDDGRSTPTATRLEGLLALYSWLEEDDPLRGEIAKVASAGVGFLRRCQLTSGPAVGGVMRALRKLNSEGADFNRRQDEVRIDYVQHALSAWLAYTRLGFEPAPR
jgi:hypothetical protein